MLVIFSVLFPGGGLWFNSTQGYSEAGGYIYDLANAFNRFYHETKILVEEDIAIQGSYIKLLILTKKVMELCIDVLGFEAPDKM